MALLDFADFIYANQADLALNLTGFWVSDREPFNFLTEAAHVITLPIPFSLASLSWDVVQEQVPAVNFVHKYENIFNFKYTFATIAQPDIKSDASVLIARLSWPNSTHRRPHAITAITWRNS